MKVSSWGLLSRDEHVVCELHGATDVSPTIAGVSDGIAHGMGRSYGDVCLNPGRVIWQTNGLDQMLAFDDVTGSLTVEAGVLLRDIQRSFIPRGWSLPVTPGTQQITVGGAIANDVHGKSHHVHGTFGHNVVGLELARTDGSVLRCSSAKNTELFAATIGGLGLTGVITSATLRLRRIPGPWMSTETIPFHGIAAFMELSDSSDAGWEHSVAWIDCLSGAEPRGLFMRGNHVAHSATEPTPLPLAVPFGPPMSLVNRLTLKPLNFAYRMLGERRAGARIEYVEKFLYPLDGVSNWNRAYGRHGFYQYQSVVPPEYAAEATREMLKIVQSAGEGSFLAVLKRFGDRPSLGMLSFPRPGFTLAIDFPNTGDRVLRMFDRLDAVVRSAGGAMYFAKDARMSPEMARLGYPMLDRFLELRDPGMSSAMSRRLFGI